MKILGSKFFVLFGLFASVYADQEDNLASFRTQMQKLEEEIKSCNDQKNIVQKCSEIHRDNIDRQSNFLEFNENQFRQQKNRKFNHTIFKKNCLKDLQAFAQLSREEKIAKAHALHFLSPDHFIKARKNVEVAKNNFNQRKFERLVDIYSEYNLALSQLQYSTQYLEYLSAWEKFWDNKIAECTDSIAGLEKKYVNRAAHVVTKVVCKRAHDKKLEKKYVNRAAHVVTKVVCKRAYDKKKLKSLHLIEQNKLQKKREQELQQKAKADDLENETLSYLADFMRLLDKEEQDNKTKSIPSPKTSKTSKASKASKASKTPSKQQKQHRNTLDSNKQQGDDIDSVYDEIKKKEAKELERENTITMLVGSDCKGELEGAQKEAYDQESLDHFIVLKRVFPLKALFEYELREYADGLLDLYGEANKALILELIQARQHQQNQIIYEKEQAHKHVAEVLSEYKSILENQDQVDVARLEHIRNELVVAHNGILSDYNQKGLPFFISCDMKDFLKIQDLLEQLTWKEKYYNCKLPQVEDNLKKTRKFCESFDQNKISITSPEVREKTQARLLALETEYNQIQEYQKAHKALKNIAQPLQSVNGILNPTIILGEELLTNIILADWYRYLNQQNLDEHTYKILKVLESSLPGYETIMGIAEAFKEAFDKLNLYNPEHRIKIAHEFSFQAFKKAPELCEQYKEFKLGPIRAKKSDQACIMEFEKKLKMDLFKNIVESYAEREGLEKAAFDLITLKSQIADFVKMYVPMLMKIIMITSDPNKK